MQCPEGRHCSFGVQREGIVRLWFGVAALSFSLQLSFCFFVLFCSVAD